MLANLSILALTLVAAAPRPVETGRSVEPGEFLAWFEQARAGRLVIPDDVRAGARRYRYVFVEGFANEQIPGYFARNLKALRARGVPRRSIHVIEPSSHRTIGENAAMVRDGLFEAAKKGPERLVIIAHSRGACDALAFALENPDFVRDRVQALFLVQGPFGGTAVADYVSGEGAAIDRRMPWRHRVVAHLLGRLEALRLARGGHGGLAGMTRRASREFWARSLEEHSAAVPVVGPRTFYVTGATRPSRLPFFQKAMGWYLGSYYGPNDGLVALEDQSLPGVGTVLAVLDVAHGDLTSNAFASRPRRRLRTALIDAVLMTVARAEPTELP